MTAGLMLEDVTFRYGDLWVLRSVRLHVPQGGDLLVTGDNGAGKSTFLHVCAGVLQASAGRVLFNGYQANASRPSDLVRHGVRRGVVFDGGGLLSNLHALANVALGLRYHADILGIDDREIVRRAKAALSELRVSSTDFHTLPAHLSLGVRKRVSIARALVQQPNFAFFDDPDAGLDAATREVVCSILERLRDDPELTMVVTTSSRALAERLGEEFRCVHLSDGLLTPHSDEAALVGHA